MTTDITVVHSIDVGDVPPTPIDTSYKFLESHKSIRALKYVISSYGHLIGYSQEQNGNLIHNVLPIPQQALNQISSSSETALALHTELAFHPYKPDYVFLMCLREDLSVLTTYAVLNDILTCLSDETIAVLHQEWFTTTIDLSFILNGAVDKTISTTVLTTTNDGVTFTYDEALIKPVNELADAALKELKVAVNKSIRYVALETGDLLILNNRTVVHGRNPFKPKYDGTDRWLQRALVIKERPPDIFMQESVCTYTFEDTNG